MRKRTGVVGAALAAVIGASIVGVVASQASAATTGTAARDLVAPAVTTENSQGYTVDQLPEVWTKVKDNFALKFPPGYGFDQPFYQKGDFPAEGDGKVVVDAALPDMFAANYWRCAWLDAGLSEGTKVSKADLSSALQSYWSLPSVRQFDETGLDEATLSKLAAKAGYADGNSALYALACEGFEK